MSRPAFSWLFIMAWRDSRSQLRRLLLFVSSIIIGIAALVSIRSFGENLNLAVNEQAKSLLGADVVFSSSQEFSQDILLLADSLLTAKAREISMPTMLFYPAGNQSKLVQLRAYEGEWPFYGALETESSPEFNLQQLTGALIDKGLAIQLDVKPGDEIAIGSIRLPIQDILRKIPGEAAAANLVGPRVFIPYALIPNTGLIQRGSRLSYKILGEVSDAKAIEAYFTREKRAELRRNQVSVETVSNRKQSLGRALDNMYSFLNLVAFIALILGAVGVASSISIYARQKLATVGILRCLGASGAQALGIFLVQLGLIGLAGSLLGAIMGTALLYVLPSVFADFLPLDIQVQASIASMIWGVGIGAGFVLLFGLIPLLKVRLVSPLITLRQSDVLPTNIDWLRWALISIIPFSVYGFAWFQTGKVLVASFFTLGLFISFGVLVAASKLVLWVAPRIIRPEWSFFLRQGISNLFRPQNQTLTLVSAIGLGTFLISTLYLSQDAILKQVEGAGTASQANLAFFDVQSDQIEDVRSILEEQDVRVIAATPFVTMRLSEINGRKTVDMANDPEVKAPRWALRREYRSSYRDTLTQAEELMAGTLVKNASMDDEIIPITIEGGLFDDLNLSMGDTLVWDVQGIPISTYISGIRKVDWSRPQANVFVLFPNGVLEDAPQFFVVLAKSDSEEQQARAQYAIVRTYPNVSTIDLNVILETLDSVLNRVSFAIRFMALFSIFTGFVVLLASIWTSKYQRIRESALLKTLGAQRALIRRIMSIEFLTLGVLAAFIGSLLSYAATWGLTVSIFKTPFIPDFMPLLISVVGIGTATVSIGLLNIRSVFSHTPLEVLRAE